MNYEYPYSSTKGIRLFNRRLIAGRKLHIWKGAGRSRIRPLMSFLITAFSQQYMFYFHLSLDASAGILCLSTWISRTSFKGANRSCVEKCLSSTFDPNSHVLHTWTHSLSRHKFQEPKVASIFVPRINDSVPFLFHASSQPCRLGWLNAFPFHLYFTLFCCPYGILTRSPEMNATGALFNTVHQTIQSPGVIFTTNANTTSIVSFQERVTWDSIRDMW